MRYIYIARGVNSRNQAAIPQPVFELLEGLWHDNRRRETTRNCCLLELLIRIWSFPVHKQLNWRAAGMWRFHGNSNCQKQCIALVKMSSYAYRKREKITSAIKIVLFRSIYRFKIYINLRSKCNIIKLMISKVIILFIIWIKIKNWNNNSYFFYIYAAYYTIFFSSFLCLSIKLLVHLSQAWNFCQNQYYSPIVLPLKTIEKLRINYYFSWNKLFFND